MALYGYVRFFFDEKDLSQQVVLLRGAGCVDIHTEARGSAARRGKSELDALFALIAEGDVVVVTTLIRLAPTIGALHRTVATLESKGAFLLAVEQGVDTRGSASTDFRKALDAFVEFDQHVRSERQREGIAAAKLRRVYQGRKPSIDAAEILRLHVEERMGATSIARRLGIGRTSVYRVLTR